MISRLFHINAEDRRPFVWSAGWFATVLGGYYIVRPVREAVGSMDGASRLPYYFTAVFLTMLVAVPVYGWLVAQFSRRRLVPVIYRFLTLNLVLFSMAMHMDHPQVTRFVAPVFFVWVAVYILFATSLFWSVQADLFSRERGKRLFGAISGCGTVGSLGASLLVGTFGEQIGPKNLLLVSAGLMYIGLYCFGRLDLSQQTGNTGSSSVSFNPFRGFVQVVRSPYLRSIMLYTFATTICGTYLYLTQAEMLNMAWPDPAQRTQMFARIDFGAQAVTVICQFVIAGRLMRYSLTAALLVLPGVYLLSLAGLWLVPVLPVLVAAMILSRGSTYGLAVPAAGVLYTVVTREEKYKAKSVIDTLVIRGGDVAMNWTLTILRVMSPSMSALAIRVLPAAAVAFTVALLLKKRHAALPRADTSLTTSAESQ